jgi:hypothetical protein
MLFGLSLSGVGAFPGISPSACGRDAYRGPCPADSLEKRAIRYIKPIAMRLLQLCLGARGITYIRFCDNLLHLYVLFISSVIPPLYFSGLI